MHRLGLKVRFDGFSERLIDPAETRIRLRDWAELAYEVLATRELGPRGRTMRP